MHKQPSSITSLPRSPEDDRRSRMIKYSITMGIRVVCVVLCLFVRGWWLLICAAGAVFLPYVAVVLANVVDTRTSAVERPGSIVRLPSGTRPSDDQGPSPDPTSGSSPGSSPGTQSDPHSGSESPSHSTGSPS